MMQRQQAFTGNTPLLKGGLHCHTTRSDGSVEPGDVVRLHKENGYDFLAITDHRRYNFENFAPDADVLIIPGMEMDGNLDNEKGMCFHTVIIGPEKQDGNGYEQDQRFDSANVKDQFGYQPVLDDAYAKNNLAFYCHPDWSSTPYTSFDKMEGIFGMEIWNSGCVIEDGMDSNAYCWDDLLREGKKLWGIATDDGHAPYHHCKGWVMVNAEKNVNSVLKALKEGAFYSSTGPEIYDFYVDGNTAVVKCSPVSRIRFLTGCRPARMKTGEGITEFTIEHSTNSWNTPLYLRVEITDAEGRMAWSNPIFMK